MKRLLMNRLLAVASFLICVVANTQADDVPQTVEQAWADYDPRQEPLEIEVIRESLADGIVLRHVWYVVGTFDGKKTRVAAFYAFPKDGENLPGIVQLHGGGQRARSETAQFWASHGYAAIAVNWGEHVIGEDGDPNTDWDGLPAGFLEPKHHNDVTPGEGTIHGVPHPWNSSWLLYSAAARRAVTFLEERPEANGSNVGVTGHSMGGRLTVLTAIDARVKATSPAVRNWSGLSVTPGRATRSISRQMARRSCPAARTKPDGSGRLLRSESSWLTRAPRVIWLCSKLRIRFSLSPREPTNSRESGVSPVSPSSI